MKEATGELNMTVITVILVAVLVAFFYSLIWPMIKNNISSSSGCKDAVCSGSPDSQGMVTCKIYKNANDKKPIETKCVYKG